MSDIKRETESYLSEINVLSRKADLNREECNGYDGHSNTYTNPLLDISAEISPDDENAGPVVFPRYRVSCGEKIIIDFEHSGSTWRDEHSGPFSWMTRSQQDLTLAEIFGEELSQSERKRQERQARASKSLSPEYIEPSSPFEFKPEYKPQTSVSESPFLKADRELSPSYKNTSFEISERPRSRTSGGLDDTTGQIESSLPIPTEKDYDNDGKVYIEPIGESSTDYSGAAMPLIESSMAGVCLKDEPVQLTKEEQDDSVKANLLASNVGTDFDDFLSSSVLNKKEESEPEQTSMTKTGFDFLDNW